MRSYLDFEKPVAEIEARIEELRALNAGDSGPAISEEISMRTSIPGKKHKWRVTPSGRTPSTTWPHW